MGVFDFDGASNMPDAGGGDPSSPPPVGLPSVASGPPLPPPPEPPSAPPTVDPRLQAALAALQPKPTPPPWQQAIQKIVPLIGAAFAMHNNAGGSFTNSYQQAQDDAQKRSDQEAERTLRLATILHQQEQERQATVASASRERTAQMRIDAAAQKEAADKKAEAERTLWGTVSQGDTVAHANEIAQSQGREAADQYLASFTGLNGSLKDLADKYGVRDTKTGEIALGKSKTPKEATAGSKEEYVLRSRAMLEQQLGRPLTDDETQKADEKSLKRYGSITKDDDLTNVLKGIQIGNAKLESELKQQAIDRGYAEKFGSAPQYFQDGEWKIHGYVYDKTKNRTVEIPVDIPEGVTKIQPPNAFMSWLKGLTGSKAPAAVVPIGGNGPAPTDPNWGK